MISLNISGTVTMTSSLLMPWIAAWATWGIETIGNVDLLEITKLVLIRILFYLTENSSKIKVIMKINI